MKHALLAACVAVFAATVLPAGAHGPEQGTAAHPETVTPLFKHVLPNVPGKALVAIEVSFPPGAAAAPHTHPASAFLYAYVLSGEISSLQCWRHCSCLAIWRAGAALAATTRMV